MNNKFTRSLLIIGAVAVWGIIIFKIIGYLNNDDTAESNFTAVKKSEISQIPDTVKLLLNYPDPFLGGKIEQEPAKNYEVVQTAKVVKTSPEPVAAKPLLNIKYFGLITNKQTQKLVAIININGKQYLAKPGDNLDQVMLLKMYNDSILITHESTKKWIRK